MVFSLALLVASSPLALGRSFSGFDSFIAEHTRTYAKGSAEYEQRRVLFEERAASYERHNSNPHRLWSAAVNGLTDWTDEELRTLRGWSGSVAGSRTALRGSPRSVGRHSLDLKQQSRTLPSSVNWTHLNSTATAHNQGGCGSCWAYATTLAMEAVHENIRGHFQEFNPTQLVECSPNPHSCGGTGGCSGSTAEMAMIYVAENGLNNGVECGRNNNLLQKNADDSDWQSFLLPGVHTVPEGSPARSIGLIAWERLPENEAEPLMRALVDWGVVAVSVSADYWGGYREGVFGCHADDTIGCGCDADATIDHAVAMIGYGEDSGTGTKFWHISNSWGTYWGENGRIRIIRRDTDDSDCGDDLHPEQGTGCEGGPAAVRICGECGILYDSVVPHFSPL